MGTSSKRAKCITSATMKSALILAVIFGIVAYVDAAKISACSGKIVKTGAPAATFAFTTGTDFAADETITIECDRPLFKRSVTAHADELTGLTDSSRRGDKDGNSLLGTDATGTKIVVTKKTNTAAAGAITMAMTTGKVGTNVVGAPGLYTCTVDASNADTKSDGFLLPVFAAAATPAVGLPTLGTSSNKGTAPGTYTFNFGTEAGIADTKIVTITASEKIFVVSETAAATNIESVEERLGNNAAASCKGTSTWKTDATGKIGYYTNTGDGMTAGRTIALVLKAAALEKNPATSGLVTLSIKADGGDTNLGTAAYPIYDAASTAIFMGSTVATDEKSTAPGAMTFTIVPQTTLAAAGKYTITASAAIFKTSQTPTVECAHNGGTSIAADCTSASDATGKIFTVTLAQNSAAAGFPITIKMTDQAADNGATPGTITFGMVASAGDDTATSTDNPGYTIFNAATTAFWVGGTMADKASTATSGTFTVDFVPQNAVQKDGTVVITADKAIFDKSATGITDIVCTSTKNRYATAVGCSAATDADGKKLTVTLLTTGEDLFASAAGKIVLSKKIAKNGAKDDVVKFGFETSTDTTALATQTGYTITAAPPPPPAPTSNATNGTTSSSTTTPEKLTGKFTVVKQAVTFSKLVHTDYKGNVKLTYECAYLQVLDSTWCVSKTGSISWLKGIAMKSAAAAARRAGSKVTFEASVQTSVKSASQLQTLVTTKTSGFDTAFKKQFDAVNTATGYSIADPGTIKADTATFDTSASGSSGAGMVIPSTVVGLAAIVASLVM